MIVDPTTDRQNLHSVSNGYLREQRQTRGLGCPQRGMLISSSSSLSSSRSSLSSLIPPSRFLPLLGAFDTLLFRSGIKTLTWNNILNHGLV